MPTSVYISYKYISYILSDKLYQYGYKLQKVWFVNTPRFYYIMYVKTLSRLVCEQFFTDFKIEKPY